MDIPNPKSHPYSTTTITHSSFKDPNTSCIYKRKQSSGKSNLIYKKNKISKTNSFSSITPIKRSYTHNYDDHELHSSPPLNQATTTTTVTQSITSIYDTNPNSTMYPPPKPSEPLYTSIPDVQTAMLNVEEILLLELQYNEILKCLQKGLFCSDECFEWWNFYFTSSLCNKFIEYFPNNNTFKNIIQRSTNLECLSIILCYDLSFIEHSFNELLPQLYQLIKTHHCNLILLSKYLLSKIITPRNTNQWIHKMENMININSTYQIKQLWNADLINQIKTNCDSAYDIQRIILNNYIITTNNNNNFISIFKRITLTTPYELNMFFREKVIRVLNKNGSILASSTNQTQKDFLIKNIIKVPFLNRESLKQYTLVLDLDETLVHFTDDPNDTNKGVLHFRPGLFEFLDKVSNYYELVVFTAATKEYADPILEAIEQNKIIFEYKLYREHTTIVGDDFVKDISKLGRDLSRVIIVDNMPQCFRLQKENGVFIRPFWGKDNDDCALVDLLPILVSIAKEGWDVRKGLSCYKDDIINKVTSNFYRRNFIK